jgi:hypothetical protein
VKYGISKIAFSAANMLCQALEMQDGMGEWSNEK